MQRIVLCSGKVATRRSPAATRRATRPRCVRVEQLYPWRVRAVAEVLASYPNADEIVWLQEEPENMGPRSFVSERLWPLVPEGVGYRQVSRAGSGSPPPAAGHPHPGARGPAGPDVRGAVIRLASMAP